MKPKFNIGDYVYHAAFEAATEQIPCPDCNGLGYVTIVYNGETLTPPCNGCEHGWMGSTGTVDHYVYKPVIREGEIESVEKQWSEPFGFEYRIKAGENSRWYLKEEDTFLTEHDALVRAEVLKQERDAEEVKRLASKKEPNKSWAWHVRYYQTQIRDAQKTIEYATSQLHVAKTKKETV